MFNSDTVVPQTFDDMGALSTLALEPPRLTVLSFKPLLSRCRQPCARPKHPIRREFLASLTGQSALQWLLLAGDSLRKGHDDEYPLGWC